MFQFISGDHVSPIPLFSFAAHGNVARILIATEKSQNAVFTAPRDADELQKKIDDLLVDPSVRMILLQKLSLQPASQNAGTPDGAVPFPYPTLCG